MKNTDDFRFEGKPSRARAKSTPFPVSKEDPQVELHLLRSQSYAAALEAARSFIFCAQCHSVYCMYSFLEQFDSNLKSCLSRIIQCSLPNDSWCQATLPFRLGGLGLRSSFSSAAAAFLGSCNSVHLLVSHLLSQDFHDLVFPNEKHAVATFERFTSDIFIPSSTLLK